jgi:hypothetical protein
VRSFYNSEESSRSKSLSFQDSMNWPARTFLPTCSSFVSFHQIFHVLSNKQEDLGLSSSFSKIFSHLVIFQVQRSKIPPCKKEIAV